MVVTSFNDWHSINWIVVNQIQKDRAMKIFRTMSGYALHHYLCCSTLARINVSHSWLLIWYCPRYNIPGHYHYWNMVSVIPISLGDSIPSTLEMACCDCCCSRRHYTSNDVYHIEFLTSFICLFIFFITFIIQLGWCLTHTVRLRHLLLLCVGIYTSTSCLSCTQVVIVSSSSSSTRAASIFHVIKY